MGLEILLTKLRHAVSSGAVSHKLQIIAMSATMGGLEGMCKWLDAVGGSAWARHKHAPWDAAEVCTWHGLVSTCVRHRARGHSIRTCVRMGGTGVKAGG